MLKDNDKLLFLCSYAAPYGGNFIPSLLALDVELGRHGIKCAYAFPTEAEGRPWIAQLKAAGKDVLCIDFHLAKLKFVKELEAITTAKQISIIYAHFTSVLPLEIFANLHREIRVFIHIHSDFSAGKKSLKQTVHQFLLYRVLSRHVYFFSVSPAFVEYNTKRVSLIPNGLAKNRLACEHEGGASIRKRYQVADGEILCEIFGWSQVVKGVDIAVNAIKLLNERNNVPVKLAIVCGATAPVEHMKKWIAEHTECSGNEPYLLYFEPCEDVFSYHEAADILLSASRSEGFPYSILEMLSLGKRCVISNISGTEWAKKYETTFSFATEDVDSCVAAILQAIEYGCQKNMRVAQQVNSEYSIERWVEEIAEKLKQVP
jgi:glycosyltransferase involved in cell wall biosynthesis